MPIEKGVRDEAIEILERIIYKSGDDIATSILRSFERLEERIDTVETRIYTRLSEVEEAVHESRQDMTESFDTVKESIRDIAKVEYA